jgi:hypothetical protein
LTEAIALCSSRAVDIRRTCPTNARDTSAASLRYRERTRAALSTLRVSRHAGTTMIEERSARANDATVLRAFVPRVVVTMKGECEEG